MGKSYRGILTGDRIQWRDAPPPGDQPLEVEVMVRELSADVDEQARQRRLGAALDRLAELDPFRDIKDPVAWQREVRKDRPLPGRE